MGHWSCDRRWWDLQVAFKSWVCLPFSLFCFSVWSLVHHTGHCFAARRIHRLCAAPSLSHLAKTTVVKQCLFLNENAGVWISLSVSLHPFSSPLLSSKETDNTFMFFSSICPFAPLQIHVCVFVLIPLFSIFLWLSNPPPPTPSLVSHSLCFCAIAEGVKLGECDRKIEAAGWEWKSVEG